MVAGTAVGAGVGALTSKNKGQGALVGGAAGMGAGGLVGTAVGDAVAKKKASYIVREDALSRQIALVQKQTAERHSVNASLRTTVARQQKQLAALQASGAAGNSAGWGDLQKEVANEIASVNRRARTWQETIDAHKAFVQKYRMTARGAELESSISSLDAERTELLRQRGQLEAIAQGPRR
jgi:outer membrane lipoprotein SlyB